MALEGTDLAAIVYCARRDNDGDFHASHRCGDCRHVRFAK